MLCLSCLQSVFVAQTVTHRRRVILWKLEKANVASRKEESKKFLENRPAEFVASGYKKEVEALIILLSSSQQDSVYFPTPKLLSQKYNQGKLCDWIPSKRDSIKCFVEFNKLFK